MWKVELLPNRDCEAGYGPERQQEIEQKPAWLENNWKNKKYWGYGYFKRLFIDFVLTKMSYFTSQNVGNLVQIIKYVELSRFQPILRV